MRRDGERRIVVRASGQEAPGDAKQIADRYSQSVARVVSDPDSREALGVVTLEVRSGFKPKLKDNQDLVQHLNEVAAILAPVLAIRKVTR